MIFAFHSVGLDLNEADASAVFDRIMNLGAIIPSEERTARRTMWEGCFDIRDEGVDFIENWFSFNADPVAMKALRRIAKERVAALPRRGSEQTLFNCADMIGGDLGNVFLSLGDWVAGHDNGFVFLADDLIELGARLRKEDFGFVIAGAINAAVKRRYRDEAEAEQAILDTIGRHLSRKELSGDRASKALRKCPDDRRCAGELVWKGTLPLFLAVAGWRVGERVF